MATITIRINMYDDSDNFNEFAFGVDSKWLDTVVIEFGYENIEEFLNEYTSDESNELYDMALVDGVMCTGKERGDYNYYEISFGNIKDGALADDAADWYCPPCAIAAKFREYPSIKYAEKVLASDMNMFGCDCVWSITPISLKEVYGNFDTSDIDNWPVF